MLQAELQLTGVQCAQLAAALQDRDTALDLVARRRAKVALELQAAAAAGDSDVGHIVLLQTVRWPQGSWRDLCCSVCVCCEGGNEHQYGRRLGDQGVSRPKHPLGGKASANMRSSCITSHRRGSVMVLPCEAQQHMHRNDCRV